MSGRYTVIPSPALDAQLDSALEDMARTLDSIRPRGLACVVLGGGYGRGEGGVRHTDAGDRLYNDLDLFAFSEDAGRRERHRIGEELRKIAEKWEGKLGVAVDFSPVKNLASLSGVAHTLMYQELLHGWKPVWGKADLAKRIPGLDPAELPYTEALRLLLNRGMGLIFAGEKLAAGQGGEETDFIVRNMNKAVLGCGDALLLAAGKYLWRGGDRVSAVSLFAEENGLPRNFGEAYAEAFRFKLEPCPVLPPDPEKRWTECRTFYLDTVRRVAGTKSDAELELVKAGLRKRAAGARSTRNFLRWLIRAKAIRSAGTMTDDPVLTVLCGLIERLETGGTYPPCPPKLYDLWKKFH